MSNVIQGILPVFLVMVFGGIAISAVWNVGDQTVEKSENQQLQNSYGVGKEIINTAEEVEDKWAFAKGISVLALIIGVPALIIKKIL